MEAAVAAVQNRIALEHLFQVVREAAARGKAVKGGDAPLETEFKWQD